MSTRKAVRAILARPATTSHSPRYASLTLSIPKYARHHHHSTTMLSRPILISSTIDSNDNRDPTLISRRTLMTASTDPTQLTSQLTQLTLSSTVRPETSFQQAIMQHNHTNHTNHTTKRYLAYARVNHEKEYKEEIEGKHGEQLQLAHEEGVGKDDLPFNPFDEYLLEEDDDVEDEYEVQHLEAGDVEGMQEAEYVEKGDESDKDDDLEEEEEEEDDDDDIDDDTELESIYNTDGSLKRLASEKAALRAGLPAGGNFAVIEINGNQEKVTVDDLVIMNKVKPVDKWSVGSTHTLTADDGQVLLMGNQDETLVGMPFVNGGEVDVMVEEITRDKKVIVFKKKRRKNYRRTKGHRRQVTFLRVLDIRFPSTSASTSTSATG